MSRWAVTSGAGVISFGNTSRSLTGGQGCKEPFKGSYWCPARFHDMGSSLIFLRNGL